ncbi:MAG: hypothetical protein JHC26_07905 [Thermofilum sp.]|uniref:hypothetical protein n=1 Tax=Thermofilum sp. TaxID=1961369 RepID=UPI002587FEFD|nr:hypothetical protein [Thermofilum sp.]MCI4409001.1 hypothetical protein [Thermofilum sp.]
MRNVRIECCGDAHRLTLLARNGEGVAKTLDMVGPADLRLRMRKTLSEVSA